MDKKIDLVEKYNRWAGELEEALEDNSGDRLNNATRMVLGMGVLMSSFQPNNLTYKMLDEMRDKFKAALDRMNTLIGNRDYGDSYQEHYPHYRSCIAKRYLKLDEVEENWHRFRTA